MRYISVEKKVGETPLQALERSRAEHAIQSTVPMAYAGRLDPMASGKLLILVGEECKNQKNYHSLDKEYVFEVLFGISSDTGDVLGLVRTCTVPDFGSAEIRDTLKRLTGPIKLPYPHFSSKTVQGKPLHVWTLEGRLNEIEIPTKESRIYKLKLLETKTLSMSDLYIGVSEKIETIKEVTEPSKKLGEDFRREKVRAAWKKVLEENENQQFLVATISCTASSGTYMRTLSEIIAKELGTCGLALSIHRTKIGKYIPLIYTYGFWKKRY